MRCGTIETDAHSYTRSQFIYECTRVYAYKTYSYLYSVYYQQRLHEWKTSQNHKVKWNWISNFCDAPDTNVSNNHQFHAASIYRLLLKLLPSLHWFLYFVFYSRKIWHFKAYNSCTLQHHLHHLTTFCSWLICHKTCKCKFKMITDTL